MSESFRKIKKMFQRNAAIKSAVCGVSSGLLIVGILLLSLKLSAIAINPAYYVLIGVAVCAASGAGVYFLLRPTDKMIAKHLDNEYELKEKVQTMVAYKESKDEMVVLQRADADETLGSLKIKTGVKCWWQYIVIAVLALAMFFTAVFVPAKYVPDDDVDIPFDPTEVQITALRQLINDVKASDMQEELIDPTVLVLEELLDRIDELQTTSVMRQAVISSVVMIDGIISGGNSYIPIAAQLTATDRTKPFADSLLSSILTYRTDSVKIKTLQKVNEKADKSDELIAAELGKPAAAYIQLIEELYGTALTNELTDFNGELSSALALTEYAGKDDALYNAFDEFAAAVLKVAENSKPGSGYNTARLQEQLSEACNNFVAKAAIPLCDQTYNCMMDEFIRERLAEIFGIASSELPSNSNIIPEANGGGNAEGGEDDDNDDPSHSGGYGEGENIYGSDDLIYYPDEDRYVVYGEVINSYYAAVLEHINSGDMSEELKQYIRNYFDILLSGIKE